MIRPLHRTLAEDLARAKAELNINPSITRYQMIDGRELRQRVEPWLSFRRSLQQLGQAFITIKPDLASFGEDLQRALAAMPAPRVWPPGWGTPVAPPRGLSVEHDLFNPPGVPSPDCIGDGCPRGDHGCFLCLTDDELGR